jgi:hypothetical protein
MLAGQPHAARRQHRANGACRQSDKGRKIGVVHSGAVKQFSALPLSPRHFKATKRPRRRIPMLPLLMTMGALLFTVIGYALISPDPAPHEGVEEDAGA